jgi:hypothetical protein
MVPVIAIVYVPVAALVPAGAAEEKLAVNLTVGGLISLVIVRLMPGGIAPGGGSATPGGT